MRVLGAVFWVLGALVVAPTTAHAQDSTAARPTTDSSAVPAPSTQNPALGPADTLIRRTTPMKAMFRSFLLPGWGQAVSGRKVTAGVMLGFEGLSVGMVLKIKSDIRYIEETNSPRLKDKHKQEQDWITLVVFNHLMSGLEAYVSSHLYDFPGDLELRALPGGGVGVGGTIPLGRR